MFLCRRWRTNRWRCAGSSILIFPAGYRRAQDLISIPSVQAPCASRSRRRNSWWECRRLYPTLRCTGLWSRTWTFQFRMVVCAVFKVFTQDRIQHRRLFLWNAFLSGMWSGSLIRVGLVEAFKIFSQDKVHPLLLMIQLVFMKLWMGLVQGFFSHFSPKSKTCDSGRVRECPRVSAHPRRELMWITGSMATKSGFASTLCMGPFGSSCCQTTFSGTRRGNGTDDSTVAGVVVWLLFLVA